MHKFLFLVLSLSFLFACGSGNSGKNLTELNLMEHGMPIKIKAPENAKVEASDMGLMKDVTVKGEGNYFLQITSGELRVNDLKIKKAELLASAKKNPFFDEIVEDFEDGFIFKKKISETKINYDFRAAKIQGSFEYFFQTGLMGQFSLEEVKTMYNSIK